MQMGPVWDLEIEKVFLWQPRCRLADFSTISKEKLNGEASLGENDRVLSYFNKLGF